MGSGNFQYNNGHSSSGGLGSRVVILGEWRSRVARAERIGAMPASPKLSRWLRLRGLIGGRGAGPRIVTLAIALPG